MLLGFIVFCAVTALAQDAPTLQQCRANYAMWLSPHENSEAYFDAISMPDIMHRSKVLLQCGIVGATQRPGNMVTLEDAIEIGKWSDLEGLYESHGLTRVLSFVKRHGELDQFWKEDKAGQR